MKLHKYINRIALSAVLSMSLASCSDFLDRPAEDSYNAGTFYKDDTQCIQGVNYLYNSPWYDFQRGFIKVGEVMSGNYYWGSSPYMTLTVNGTDEDLVNMSYSLWSVIGHANTVYNNLKGATASAAVKNQCMGECLAWKAMAYFFLVRSFGEVPIVHDNSTMLADGSYSNTRKVEKADIYEYIIMTLEKAMELLPKSGSPGRVDYYAAEGLLAKVYLTKSGLATNGNGQRNAEDLAKAAMYAKDVIDNSGRKLMTTYSDVFRLQNAFNSEALFSWLWTADTSVWTVQNTLQSDLGMQGFDEFGDCWGGYNGPSIDLQEAFGVSPIDNPDGRADVDVRRKATMMMAGDFYEYFWTDKTDNKGRKGFNFLQFLYDSNDYGSGGPGLLQSATGANSVKHLYGDAYDHKTYAVDGISASNMHSSLSTPILRLSDVYLIYAEAVIGNNGSTTDANAIDAFYAVRSRAIKSASRPTSLTWSDVWKERRLELAMEGDRWYDFVRRSYYDLSGAISELKQQKRNAYFGLDALYKNYYTSGSWNVNTTDMKYDTDTQAPNVTQQTFTMPYPTQDVVFNQRLLDNAIHVDVRATYSY
ncbi:RagB/SusD family nutrient uptake outer membrane protein [Prevotella sp. A2931]|uniref:RagB/SusD family nutrient uptake outer membrane protein n=2 Tax=Prevotellaceae TaxID=171552 RepID=A0ABS3M638_9BACT|nr:MULTISPECIES: RagB/SusD family nutrient uptake outer membrane protein [Prevotella]MBO1363649.1 RagB/SusD family nutrient uptake outer membrane protein [Prevotella illustrans]PTL26795.1 RagB/SusD family nutrient uptake outer membrane protein [Prevotella sp. oral taxon 820]